MRDFKITGVFWRFSFEFEDTIFYYVGAKLHIFFGFTDDFNVKGRFPSGIKAILAIFPL